MTDILGVSFTAILQIVMIDLVLSGDNAVVIAMAVKSLPPSIARKAAVIGAAGAVGLRIAFTAAAAYLLTIPFLQAVGGMILFWIAYKLLIEEEEGEETAGEINDFWEAVRIIILADLVMSLDNILAVGGAAHGDIRLLLFGLAVSIPLVLFGSQLLTTVLRKWPALAFLGSGILAWTAGSMIVHDSMVKGVLLPLNIWMGELTLPAISTFIVLGLGYQAALRKKAEAAAREARLADQVGAVGSPMAAEAVQENV